MLLGPGSNGKTALLNLLSRFLGVRNISTLSIENMTSKGFSMSELFGKMANICGEISSKTLTDTDMFKQLTGGETIGADRKFKSVIYFKNYAKIISACNKLPKTKDSADGFFRRWLLEEFENKFVDEKIYNRLSPDEIELGKIKKADPNILNKVCIKEEMEGLLIWALEGLQELIINERFTYCDDNVDNLRLKWFEKSSSFAKFMNEYITNTGNKKDSIFKDDVDNQYSTYCSINKLTIESVFVQKKLLSELFGTVEKLRTKKEENFGNVTKRAYIGITMKNIIEETND